ncbi:MAG: hypothetical protein J6M02_07035 [Clostridia bacterium]|nr:hypothetical protein [Clostridia bacterium]
MKRQERGSILTSVILMVLVMTLIGVPLLGMVVYNYRLREMDNTLRSSEYEAEMAMDRIYLVIRETVINAIEYAKSNATQAVNATSELQRTQYAALRAEYEDLWIKASDNHNQNIAEMIPDLGVSSEEIKNQLKNAATLQEAKEIYLNYQLNRRLSEIHDGELESDIMSPLYVGSVVNSEDGMINDANLKLAYNKVFQYHYQDYFQNTVTLQDGTTDEFSNVLNQINKEENYTSISADAIEIITDGSDVTKDSYLKITANLTDEDPLDDILNVNARVDFRRNKTTLPTYISSTFVVGTPEFDSVTNIEQQPVALSNPITNQGVTVGGTLNVMNNTHLEVANDITVTTYNEASGEDVDNGIVLYEGATLIAKENGGTSDSRIAVNGDVVMKNGSELSTGTNPFYYRNLYVGQASDSESAKYTIRFNGNVVAKDDLELNTDGEVTVTQATEANYYGFNDINDEGPDASSAIVVNSDKLEKKTLQFGNLYLAGRAFIDGAVSERRNLIPDSAGDYIINENGEPVKVAAGSGTHRNEDIVYKTGESIAIRGNYLAYQTPLYDNTTYTADKVKYSTYFIKNKSGDYGKSEVPIHLADSFIKADNIYNSDDYSSFDTQNKWEYFMQYASEYADILKRLKVTATVKYMIGTGFNASKNVILPVTPTNTAFKDNLAVEYEKYTQYFGYRPIGEDGKPDTTKAKTRIFGENGWIKTNSGLSSKTTGDYRLIYDMDAGKTTKITLAGSNNKGIIICRGNLEITVSDNATFSGMIVVGGNLTVTGGGTLHLADAKEENINTIIQNYLGKNSEETGSNGGLYEIFEYDNSGTTYVVTEVNDTFINVNDLINITNWKKQNVGRV